MRRRPFRLHPAPCRRVRFLKPSPNVAISPSFTYFSLSPDPDQRSTNINVLATDYNFTPDLWLRLITQHNTRTDRLYAYCLFGWRFSPPYGTLYIAYTADESDTTDEITSLMAREQRRTFFIKMTVPLKFL